MNLKSGLYNLFKVKHRAELALSINDLKNKQASGERLNVEERTAINNYERYKAHVLNSEKNENSFENKFKQLQVIANLGDWREFLKEDYF